MSTFILLLCLAFPNIQEAKTNLTLYACPSQSCEILSLISAGDQMTGIEDSEKLVGGIVWMQVVYDGLGGWVNSRHLIRVYPAARNIKNA